MANKYNEKQLEQIKASIDAAFKDPQDPRNAEILKRIKEGKMNYELKAVGLNPVKVERPKAAIKPFLTETLAQPIPEDLKVPQPKPQGSVAGRMIGDIPSDLKESAESLKQKGTEISQNLIDVYRDDEITAANKFLSTLGAGAATVVGALDEAVMGTGKLFLTDEAEKRLGEIVKERVAGTNLEKSIKDLMEWHSGLDKNTQTTLNAIVPMAELMSEFIILDKVAAPIREGISEGIDTATDVARRLPSVGEEMEGAIESGLRSTGQAIDTYQTTARAERIAEQQAKVDKAVSQIVQAKGDTQTIEAAKRALREVDPEKIQNYPDLNQYLRDRNAAIADELDQYLEQFDTVFKPEETGKYTKVGNETVIDSPVMDAIDGLENAYRKSGEKSKAVEMIQLRNKFKNQGLTVKEINDISRRYGIEFKDRAFNKMGDAKQGYNAEAFENIRRGVKVVVLERLPDYYAKTLDSAMSDNSTTLRATEKMEGKVAGLYDKITERTMAQKISRKLGDSIDALTFGGLRGFVASMLPSNIGNKAMNSIEIEKMIAKNLEEVQALEDLYRQNPTNFADKFVEWYRSVHPGLGIKAQGDSHPSGLRMSSDGKDIIPSDSIKYAFRNSEDYKGFYQRVKELPEGKNLTDNEIQKIYNNFTGGREAVFDVSDKKKINEETAQAKKWLEDTLKERDTHFYGDSSPIYELDDRIRTTSQKDKLYDEAEEWMKQRYGMNFEEFKQTPLYKSLEDVFDDAHTRPSILMKSLDSEAFEEAVNRVVKGKSKIETPEEYPKVELPSYTEKVVRFADEGFEQTDNLRGGTWYATNESKTYDFSKGENLAGVGGANRVEKELNLGKSLEVEGSPIEGGTNFFFDSDSGYTKYIPQKDVDIMDSIGDLVIDEDLSGVEMRKRIVEELKKSPTLKRAGFSEEEFYILVSNPQPHMSVADMIVSLSLKGKGYESLILKNGADTHILAFGDVTPEGVREAWNNLNKGNVKIYGNRKVSDDSFNQAMENFLEEGQMQWLEEEVVQRALINGVPIKEAHTTDWIGLLGGDAETLSKSKLKSRIDELISQKKASFNEGEIPQTTFIRGVEVKETTPPTMYHGTRNVSWLDEGQEMAPGETGFQGPGIYWTVSPKEAGGWMSVGNVEGGDVLKLNLKENIKMASISERDYEGMMLDTLDEMKKNPEKFGVDKYGVNETNAYLAVQEELEKAGFGGIKFELTEAQKTARYGSEAYPGMSDYGIVFQGKFVEPKRALDDLLEGWTSMADGSELPKYTPEMDELNLPKGTTKPIKLYRGTVEGEDLSDRLSSWSAVREVAEEHAEVNGGKVIERTIDPDDILVSLTDLTPEQKRKYGIIEDEEEFILKPLK